MNITKINEIFVRSGVEAALKSAITAQVDDWIIDLLRSGKWNPNHKSAPKSTKPDSLPPLRTMPARVGKTAKSGGLAAAQQRRKARSAADRELRNKMRSPGKGK